LNERSQGQFSNEIHRQGHLRSRVPDVVRSKEKPREREGNIGEGNCKLQLPMRRERLFPVDRTRVDRIAIIPRMN